MVSLDTLYYGNTMADWGYALLIILGAYILGKAAYWVIGNTIKKLTSKTKTKLDDIIIDMIEEPIMMAIIIFGIWYSFSTLILSEGFDLWVSRIVNVLIVMNVAWLLSRLFEALFREYIVPMAEGSESDFDDQILPIVRKGVKIIIWTLAIIIGLDNAGYNIGTMLAGLGIGGLLIAMAAKDTVANFFGGVTIYTDKPFKIRDRIKIDGFDGTVTEIGIRSTRLKTLAGTEVVLPNAIFTDNPVENITREPSRKIVLNLGLTYDTTPSQMKKAMQILDKIALENKDTNDKHLVSFNAFGDFALGILFVYYIKKGSDILNTQTEINMKILEEFNKAKLGFAFPTQTIEVVKK